MITLRWLVHYVDRVTRDHCSMEFATRKAADKFAKRVGGKVELLT